MIATDGARRFICKDPFGNSYGYSPGDDRSQRPPNNGTGFFDLWSTGGRHGRHRPTAPGSVNWNG